MIPVNLKISGLYSYLDKQEIDFTRLTEAGLFGIFGKVGSGKSTILEAMSFAIYADTARFSKSGDNRFYNMLNLKSNEAIIDFTFRAGKENKLYNVYVRLLRNSKNFEDVTLKDHLFYLVSGNDKRPIEGNIINDAIGIDYDNFKRTVIIPQGQFKDFLDLKPTARANMLKDLFGLQRFDLSSKLSFIEKKNTSALDVLSGAMLGKEGITEELLENTKKAVADNEKKLETSKGELQKKGDELNKYGTLEEDFTSYQKKKTEYTEKLQHAATYQAMEAEANEFEKVHSLFAGLLNEIQNFTQEQDKRILARTGIEQQQREEIENCDQVKIKFTEAEKAFSSNDALKDTADKLSKLILVLDQEAKLEQLEQQIRESLEKIDKEIRTKQKDLSEIIEKLEKVNAELGKQPIEDDYISAMQAWYLEMEFASAATLALLEEKKQIQDKRIALRERINKELESETGMRFKELPKDFTKEEFTKAYHEIKALAKKDLDTWQTLKAELDLKCKLQEYAGHLADGHACALCGSLDHPNPLSQKNFDLQLEELSNAITASNIMDQKLEQVYRELLQEFYELKGFQDQLSTVEEKIKGETSKSTALLAKLPKGQFGAENKDEFTGTVQLIETNKKTIKQNTQNLHEHRQTLNALAIKLDLATNQVNELKAAHQTSTGSLNAISEDLKNFDRNGYKGKSVEEINEEVQAIKVQIATNMAAFEALTKKKRACEDRILELNRNLALEQREISLIQAKLEKSSTALTEQLTKNNMTEDAVKLILDKQIDVMGLRTEIETFKAALNILIGEITALKAKTEGKVYDRAIHDALRATTAELKKQYEETNEALITLNNEVNRLSDELTKKKQIQEEFAKLTIRATDIASMRGLFKSSGFVDFVSRRYLQNVVGLANARFYKMSRQKFKMELSEKGEFLVRDFMNEGKTRLLKSLSGGQTFQAALSLSLALSESIQRNAGIEQHFFFLDEGFGTLDKESLQLVFETLKSLRQENRVVGLISHVEDLQQEMDVFLQMENDPIQGTMIKESWK